MLGVLNNKRLFQSNKNILNYSLHSTYKSINKQIEREKKNKIDSYLKPNNNEPKIITLKQNFINIVTVISITSFMSYFINKYK